MLGSKQPQPKIAVPIPEEPSHVFMTQAEWDQIQKTLGVECAWFLCQRADEYADDYPKKWSKYKSHYRTLLNWHRMKVENGYDFFVHPKHGPGYYRQWVIDKAGE